MDELTRNTLFSSASGEYGTPDWVYKPLAERFEFTLDAAASHENHKTPLYYTTEGLYSKHFTTPSRRSREDGLTGPWHIRGQGISAAADRVWLNPPYGRGIDQWVRKCATEMAHVEVVVALLPARTETDWFQRWVFPYAECHFLMGRIQFDGGDSSAPFPSVIAVYDKLLRIPQGSIRGYTCDLRSDPVFHYHGLA